MDLILLDIMMPGMDGYEVCRTLKKDKQTKPIPVIFLTALESSEDEAKGLKLGAVDYITKPFQASNSSGPGWPPSWLCTTRASNCRRHNLRLEELVAERSQQLAEAHRRLLTVDAAKYDFLQVIYQDLWAPEKGRIDLSRQALGLLNPADPAPPGP